jgi:hypothetical protein
MAVVRNVPILIAKRSLVEKPSIVLGMAEEFVVS